MCKKLLLLLDVIITNKEGEEDLHGLFGYIGIVEKENMLLASFLW